MGIHAEVVTDGLHLRGFAGLPDGSAWLVDELVWTGSDRTAGQAIARRMLSAGAADLLRDAEAMVT